MIYVLVQKDNEEQSMSKKDLEVFLRRQKVWNLYIQGFTHEQIAKKEGVHPKTVSRDFNVLKIGAIEWMETLPEGEMQLYFKKNYEFFENLIQELFKIYENTKDENLKIKILNEVAQKKKVQNDMLDPKKLVKVREMIIHERDFKSYYGRTPHHLDPQCAIFSKIGQNS